MVGLGNPGDEYEDTRHNAGYRVAEEFLRRHGAPRARSQARALVARVTIEGTPIVVARPVTFMNRSGASVAALLKAAEAGPEDLLVVCDDLYLDLGSVRLRPAGGHGGHNGLRSIIDALGTRDFARLRVGVGPADAGVPHADFVLAPFRRREREAFDAAVNVAADCVLEAAQRGVPAAMNRFNGA